MIDKIFYPGWATVFFVGKVAIILGVLMIAVYVVGKAKQAMDKLPGVSWIRRGR
jgi:hypothetical protein